MLLAITGCMIWAVIKASLGLKAGAGRRNNRHRVQNVAATFVWPDLLVVLLPVKQFARRQQSTESITVAAKLTSHAFMSHTYAFPSVKRRTEGRGADVGRPW